MSAAIMIQWPFSAYYMFCNNCKTLWCDRSSVYLAELFTRWYVNWLMRRHM